MQRIQPSFLYTQLILTFPLNTAPKSDAALLQAAIIYQQGEMQGCLFPQYLNFLILFLKLDCLQGTIKHDKTTFFRGGKNLALWYSLSVTSTVKGHPSDTYVHTPFSKMP